VVVNPVPDDQEHEVKDCCWRVAQAFQPVNWLKHRLESLCHTFGHPEIVMIVVLSIPPPGNTDFIRHAEHFIARNRLRRT
jgi:hypothetical protein